jgi:hypothetical protein
MSTRKVALCGTFIVGLLGAAQSAVAGCCPPAVAMCVCPVAVPERYVVEQGPIFTGPGPCLRQPSDPPPGAYPYVGYVYAGYPYGEYGVGGYPRGFYSPYLGYPYAEPYPPHAVWPRLRHSRHYSWRSTRAPARAAAFAR